VETVETFKAVVFVAQFVKIQKMSAVVQPGFYQSGTKRTRVLYVHMFMSHYWIEMKQCFIKKVKDAPVAVFIARSLYPNAHVA
jgi:hypothetical protein